MAAFGEHVELPVVTKNFTDVQNGFVQRGPDDSIVISESLNVVSAFKSHSKHPLKSWSFKQKDCLACPVVFDFKNNCFVSAHHSKELRLWTEEENDLENARRGLVVFEVFCLVGVPNSEPLVVYRSGCYQLLSSAVRNENPCDLKLAEDRCIKWVDAEIFENSLYVVFIVEEKKTKRLTFNRQIVSTEQNVIVESLQKELVNSDEHVIAWCLNHINLHFYTLWSDKQLTIIEKNRPELSKVCTLSWTASPPFAIAMLDETHLIMTFPPNPAAELDTRLELWDTKFTIKQAVTHLDCRHYSGNCLMTVLNNTAYVRFDQSILSIAVEFQPSSLASALGKSNISSKSSNIDWKEKLFRWKTSGTVSYCSKKDRLMLGVFSESQKTFSKLWQDNITWLIDKGDIQTISRLLDKYSDIPESVLVSILDFVLSCSEIMLSIADMAEEDDDYMMSEKRAMLINRLLSLPFTDAFLVAHLRKMPLKSVLLLLHHLHQLLKMHPLTNDESSKLTLEHIVDWICLLLDAHFSELTVSASQEVRELLENLNETVVTRCEVYEELEVIAKLLDRPKVTCSEHDAGLYCIEYIEL